jgi:alkylation response protein AidB-like acyl-CoA dehydrogenase
MINKNIVPGYETAMAKVYGTETAYHLGNEWCNLLASYGQLDIGSRYAFDDLKIARVFYSRATRALITAGTSEIMRNIIALQLGLPRE